MLEVNENIPSDLETRNNVSVGHDKTEACDAGDELDIDRHKDQILRVIDGTRGHKAEEGSRRHRDRNILRGMVKHLRGKALDTKRLAKPLPESKLLPESESVPLSPAVTTSTVPAEHSIEGGQEKLAQALQQFGETLKALIRNNKNMIKLLEKNGSTILENVQKMLTFEETLTLNAFYERFDEIFDDLFDFFDEHYSPEFNNPQSHTFRLYQGIQGALSALYFMVTDQNYTPRVTRIVTPAKMVLGAPDFSGLDPDKKYAPPSIDYREPPSMRMIPEIAPTRFDVIHASVDDMKPYLETPEHDDRLNKLFDMGRLVKGSYVLPDNLPDDYQALRGRRVIVERPERLMIENPLLKKACARDEILVMSQNNKRVLIKAPYAYLVPQTPTVKARRLSEEPGSLSSTFGVDIV